MIFSYRRFGNTSRFLLYGSEFGPIYKGQNILPLKMGLTGCPETSVTNQLTLRKIPEERRLTLISVQFIKITWHPLMSVKGQTFEQAHETTPNSFSLSSDKTQVPRLWESFECSQRSRRRLGNCTSYYSALSHAPKFPKFKISRFSPFIL
jgi:hypothetical protein